MYVDGGDGSGSGNKDHEDWNDHDRSTNQEQKEDPSRAQGKEAEAYNTVATEDKKSLSHYACHTGHSCHSCRSMHSTFTMPSASSIEERPFLVAMDKSEWEEEE